MGLYHRDGGNNNDFTARKYVIIRLFTQKLGLDHSKTNYTPPPQNKKNKNITTQQQQQNNNNTHTHKRISLYSIYNY